MRGAKILVAKGLAFPLSVDVIHGCHLEEGFMKVQVDMVMDGCEEYDLPMPIPDSDVQKLGQAIRNFVQWEIRSVVLRQVYIYIYIYVCVCVCVFYFLC